MEVMWGDTKTRVYPFQGMEGKLGVGAGVVGVYGLWLLDSFCKVGRLMGLDKDTILMDVGSGLSRPQIIGVNCFGVAKAYGIEIDARVPKCPQVVWCGGTLTGCNEGPHQKKTATEFQSLASTVELA